MNKHFKSAISIVICTVASLGIYAQTTTSNVDSSQSANTAPYGKWEIGLNIAPMATVLLGGYPDRTNFNAKFKRQTNSNQFMRAQLGFRAENGQLNPFLSSQSVLLSSTDSTERRLYFQNQGYAAQLNLGYEWRIPKGKVHVIYGADLVYRYAWQIGETFEEEVLTNTGTNPGNFERNFLGRKQRVNAAMHQIGVQPFYGVWINLGQRFALSMNMAMDVSFGYGEQVFPDQQLNLSKKTVSTFDTDFGALISDMSIFVKF